MSPFDTPSSGGLLKSPLTKGAALSSDAPRQDVIQEITRAWEAAQKQLSALREAVARTGQMAQLKVESEFLHRDLDRAFRDLGEAVWGAVKAGRLELPRGLSALAKAVEEVERRLAAQAGSIEDILSEGEEAARRMKTVAAQRKKR